MGCFKFSCTSLPEYRGDITFLNKLKFVMHKKVPKMLYTSSNIKWHIFLKH